MIQHVFNLLQIFYLIDLFSLIKSFSYVRKCLGDDRPERCELDAALNELDQAKTKIAFLEEELSELKGKLDDIKIKDETPPNQE